jgi:hypothetical protein
MPELIINYWAVLAAAVVNMAVGALWYSPMMFANNWMKLIGKKKEELSGNANQSLALMFVGALVMAYVMAHFVGYAQADTMLEGVVTAFWAWLGFVATTQVSEVLFERRPFNLFMINAGYYLVAMLLMGWVLAIWQ